MTQPGGAGRQNRRRWLALAVVLGIAGACCLVMWGASSDRTATATAAQPVAASPTATGPEMTPTSATTVVPPTRPVALTIPAIDVRTRLVRLGQHQDGTVQVPGDPAVAGWFRYGPPPGAAGSSVILGHVDSVDGPAVFYRLKELSPGDRIAVRMEDGSSVRFRVHSVETYANAAFPAEKVYGKQGRSLLNLVTCGGAYDSSRGGYQSNVVVNARRVE